MKEVNTNLEELSGAELIERVLNLTGWTIGQLANQIGYAERTLKGVRSGELETSSKLQKWLIPLIQNLEHGTKIGSAEVPGNYRVTVFEPNQPPYPDIPTVDTIRPEDDHRPIPIVSRLPEARSMSADETAAVIEELQELLRDFGSASTYGRRHLIDRIEKLTAALRASVPPLKR